MFTKFRKVTLMISGVLALVLLAGCTGTMNGGGVVSLLDVQTGNGTGVATNATVAVSATCNDHKDGFRATLHLTDNDNGANFTALLPWTAVADVTGGAFTSCADAVAFVEANGFSVAGGLINSQGQAIGAAAVVVSEPGVGLPNIGNPCSDLQTVAIQAVDDVNGSTSVVLPGGEYAAIGCLDQGKINIQ